LVVENLAGVPGRLEAGLDSGIEKVDLLRIEMAMVRIDSAAHLLVGRKGWPVGVVYCPLVVAAQLEIGV
jgi:hypothetical protein